MIKIKNICKNFDNLKVLDNVSFTLEKGTICGLVGPNGAGKSTLFKILMGLLESDGGNISVAGEIIQFGDTSYKSKIGYAPESPQLYEYLTGVEFLRFIAAAKKIDKKISPVQIQNWISFFNLEEKANELVINYSQGMRRKISLCGALIGNPEILLLDEATNGLDPESSYRFKDFLREYCENGGTVLFSSHIIETMEHLCDRIIILVKGTIKEQLERHQWQNLRKDGSSLEQLFMRLVKKNYSNFL